MTGFEGRTYKVGLRLDTYNMIETARHLVEGYERVLRLKRGGN